jgi:adenylate cyclase
MSDIFISYARSTADQAQAIAVALRALGYGVWRDDEIPANRAYADVIEERLVAAKAVLVVWSAEAARSEWVRSEAERARSDRKLVQVSVDGARLPMPFDQTQCADLAGWTAGHDSPGWKQVVGAIANLAAPSQAAQKSPQAAIRKLSICVLPFANMSGDPEQEYFSDGISEDIITDLSKVSALSVTARNNAFSFKGRNVEIPEIVQKLGVSHVLEGSVRKAGNRVRITAQLIDGAAGDHLWADRWDRNLDDIFALQDEISQAIVEALKVRLAPAEKKAIEKRGTDNVEAYDLILMARNLRSTGSMNSQVNDTIVRLADRAIALDPNYALAWATKARTQFTLKRMYGQVGDGGAAAAERALEIDPNLAEAHAVRATRLRHEGRNDEALSELELALRLDPESFDVNYQAGLLHHDARRFDLAAQYFEAAVKLNDANYRAAYMLITIWIALGDPERARAAAAVALERAEKVLAQDRTNGDALASGVYALAALGEAERAKEWSARALLLDPDSFLMRYNFACTFSRLLGDADTALEHLAHALTNDPVGDNLNSAKDDPDFDPIRGDPRFQALIAEAEARLTNVGG